MLEPVVRPDGGAGGSRLPTSPIEQVSFEALLENARALDGATATEGSTAPSEQATKSPVQPGPLDELMRLDRVTNVSMRVLMQASGVMVQGSTKQAG
jgi:hypothetical protein